jgi:methyltransferase (TIGR00027 family)
LRYAAPGLRWFEVDHPSTSADKKARLDRLGIDSSAVRFVAHDLAEPGLGQTLMAAGFDPNALAQVICEGVVVYLEPYVFASLLRELRSVAAPGSRLAVSLSVVAASVDRRAAFREKVAGVGEPVRSDPLDADDAVQVFNANGWELADISERSRGLGLLVLRPF